MAVTAKGVKPTPRPRARFRCMTYTCTTCGEARPESEFSKDKSRKSGRNPRCRSCMSAYLRSRLPAARRAEIDAKRAEVAALAAQGQKRCSRCGDVKATDQFGPSKQTNDGLYPYCFDCRRAVQRIRYQSNADVLRVVARHTARKYRYGVTKEQYAEMVERQQNRCRICKAPMEPPQIDHDHETGAVRDLLCSPCNRGLGNFRDDPELLRVAADYLTFHRTAQEV